MGELITIFKALSDPLRLRILRVLIANGHEAYGGELAKTLKIPAYRLSRHLKVLKSSGLVNERREGRWVFYSLAQRDGGLLGVLRRLLAEPASNGRRLNARSKRPRRMVRTHQRQGRRHQRALIESETFNWDQGPAIPGIL